MMPFGHKDSVGTFPNHLAFPYDIVDKRSEYVITADIPGASKDMVCLLYTSPSPRDATLSRMPSSA